MGWFEAFKRSYQNAVKERKDREMMARVDKMMEETEVLLRESDETLSQLAELSPEELRLLEWFTTLPEGHKRVVEACQKIGIPVTPENFDSILEQVPMQSRS